MLFFAKFPIKGAYRSMVLIHTMFVVALINFDFFLRARGMQPEVNVDIFEAFSIIIGSYPQNSN